MPCPPTYPSITWCQCQLQEHQIGSILTNAFSPPGLSPTYLSNKYMTFALINENTKRKFGSYYLDPPPTCYSLTWAYINGTTYLTNNPSRSPSSNLFLVWKNGVQHKGQNKIIVECAYIPMLVSWSSWKVNKVICIPHWSGTNIRTCPHKGI